MRVEHVMQFHPWISYDCKFCHGLILYTSRDLFNHCKTNHLLCNLCNSALKDQNALRIHNDKHHKKPSAAAAKLVPTPQPGAQPPPTEADTLEEAEVPSPSGDDTTADTSGASEVNVCPACTGFRCGKCNVYCPTEASFKIHIQKHKNIPCPFCPQKWFNTASRDKHIQNQHKDKINTISCRVVDCPEKFLTEKELHRHLRHQHTVMFMWRCKEKDCFDCFEDLSGLLQHGASHGRQSYLMDPSSRKQWFICSTCREMFDTLHQLMIHTGVHLANKYQCDECGWYFAFIHALTIHGRDCHDSRHHACQWCTDYFSNLEGLLLHIRSKHSFECTSCFVTFPSVDELKEHEVAKHGGAQPSKDEQLLRRRREQRLKAQQDEEKRKKVREEATTQEKYFGCTNCSKSFSSQKDLDDHTTKEHIFICGECYRIFLASGERDRHMVESPKKKEKPLSGQDKLLVDEWQKRRARKEKDRRAQQEWDEAWEAYVRDKSKKEAEKKKKPKKTKEETKAAEGDDRDEDDDYHPSEDAGDASSQDPTYEPSKKECCVVVNYSSSSIST